MMGGLAKTSPSLDNGNVALRRRDFVCGSESVERSAASDATNGGSFGERLEQHYVGLRDYHLVFGGRVSPLVNSDVGRGAFRLQVPQC